VDIQWKVWETGWIFPLTKHEEKFKFSTPLYLVFWQQENPTSFLDFPVDCPPGRIFRGYSKFPISFLSRETYGEVKIST
jgi:hypothetical protein